MLHTGTDLLTDNQRVRLQALFGSDDHVEVEATWAIYQRMIAAYREPDRTRSRELMRHLIDSVSHGVPAALTEVITLGRTLARRAAGILAYFDRPGTSNGPTEAVNGRLEHLRGTALGFRIVMSPSRRYGVIPALGVAGRGLAGTPFVGCRAGAACPAYLKRLRFSAALIRVAALG